MAERDENGRFIKGSTGNPRGRMPKERETKFYELTLNTVTFEDWKAIVKKAVAQAQRGDGVARKWLSDYLIGPPVQRQEHTGEDGNAILIQFVEKDDGPGTD